MNAADNDRVWLREGDEGLRWDVWGGQTSVLDIYEYFELLQ